MKEGEDSGLCRWSSDACATPRAFRVTRGAELVFHEMIATLESERDREVATLWALGLTHAQIGEQLGLDANTVRQNWHRIREALRDAMEEPHQ